MAGGEGAAMGAGVLGLRGGGCDGGDRGQRGRGDESVFHGGGNSVLRFTRQPTQVFGSAPNAARDGPFCVWRMSVAACGDRATASCRPDREALAAGDSKERLTVHRAVLSVAQVAGGIQE